MSLVGKGKLLTRRLLTRGLLFRPSLERARGREIVAASITTILALGSEFALSSLAGSSAILPSLAGSCVILFGAPRLEMAAPRSFFGGHIIGVAVGMTFQASSRLMVGPTELQCVVGAVAVTLALMLATNTVHSPAGASPIVVILGHVSLRDATVSLIIGLGSLYFWSLVYRRLFASNVASCRIRAFRS